MKPSTDLVVALSLSALVALTACADDYYDGYGPGYGYSSYYDGAYGTPYWGWYGNYYYPGTGIYVYDRARNRREWNGRERRYWEGRTNGWRGDRGAIREDWRGFDHYPRGGTDRWHDSHGDRP